MLGHGSLLLVRAYAGSTTRTSGSTLAATQPADAITPPATDHDAPASRDPGPRNTRRIWRITANVLFLAVALSWFVLLRPTWLGGPATIVRVTGVSMEPGMETGDLAIVHAQDDYDVGEVVAFRVPEDEVGGRPYVIHRIIDEENGVYTLRGDNNDHDDPWNVRAQDIAGRLWFHAPSAGTWVTRLSDPVVLAALLAALTAFLVCIGPGETDRRPRDGHRRHKERATGGQRADDDDHATSLSVTQRRSRG